MEKVGKTKNSMLEKRKKKLYFALEKSKTDDYTQTRHYP